MSRKTTLLRWHRELFRVFWKHKSKAHTSKPRLSLATISLIKEMAAHNRLWGAERIRGELLKLDIRVSKRTIQKYMQQVRPQRARGQTWKTFLRNHAAEMWACDFLQVTDLFFRPLFAFFNTLVAVAEGDPCECDANPYRSLGRTTVARSDSCAGYFGYPLQNMRVTDISTQTYSYHLHINQVARKFLIRCFFPGFRTDIRSSQHKAGAQL